MTKVFIDGQEGTTGLKIFERFAHRSDIELLSISDTLRKDASERKRLINASDFTFLCLPDAAAIEAVSLIENPQVRIIDASTAHRTNPLFSYGLPELSQSARDSICSSSRVAVPGCYASGFISCIYPLLQAGVISPSYPVTCSAISGYSGAGKKMISQYNEPITEQALLYPRQYALTQQHKHLNEMQIISGLNYKPAFTPIVDNYYSGMMVTLPFLPRLFDKSCTLDDVYKVIASHYEGQRFIKVIPLTHAPADGFIPANALINTNELHIFVYGNDDRIIVSAVLDNLGKGASGAAVQCMNIMMGIDEATGLEKL